MYSRSMQSCYHKPSANAPSNAHKHSHSQCSQMSEYRREVNCQKLIQILFGYLLMQHDQNGPGITIFKSILLREITQNETVLRCKGWLIEVQKRGNCKTVKHSRNWQLFFFQHPFPDPNHQLNTHFTWFFVSATCLFKALVGTKLSTNQSSGLWVEKGRESSVSQSNQTYHSAWKLFQCLQRQKKGPSTLKTLKISS